MLYKNKLTVAVIVLLFVFCGTAGFYWSSRFANPPERKPVAVLSTPVFFRPKVSSETLLIKYKEYICGDREKIFEETAPEGLHGMDGETLAERFSEAEGWTVDFKESGHLILITVSDELCSVHRAYRHLGLYHGLVAVYEGPLGFNDKVLRVENIPVESLNPDFRIKLEQGMDFDRQAYPTAEELRKYLEFDNDKALNAALENLDENS